MKRILKRFVPFLMILLVLSSLIWYLFVYDRDLTRDILLDMARYQESVGNQSAAIWFYNAAYSQGDNDEDVAIELANQFKSIGNYTKAELTLSNAIKKGGNVKLYVELCKTYVEQNKLLDAVSMLESVTNPSIKAELEAMRPAAPVSNPSPGLFNEFIGVDLQSAGHVIYYSTDGEYPSTDDPAYALPIQLETGHTQIRAIAVSKEGLVSPMAILDFTIQGVVEQVSFADPAVEAAIRQLLNVEDHVTLYTSDLWKITEFTLPDEAKSAEDLDQLTYLKSLTINNPKFDGLSFIASLEYLEEVSLSGCSVSAGELAMLANMPNLTRLTLNQCGLSSIANLASASKLTYLNLNNNSIRDLSALSQMITLQELHLSRNALTGLNAITALPNLHTLDVSYNSIVSTEALGGCVALKDLNISSNGLYNLDGIGSISTLTTLVASYNNLVDISTLGKCIQLTSLDLSYNTILDISSLSTLTQLQYFNFSHNEVSKLPAWKSSLPLVSIDGSYNKLTNLNALKGMQQLNDVFMDYNPKLSSISPLAYCHRLIQVNVFGTKVSNVSALTDMGVIVNWDPT